MPNPPRTFLVELGRTVTLPQSLASGPGRTNMRLPEGAVVTLDGDRCVAESRFVNGRVRAGDWREIDPKDAPANPAEHVLVPHPDTPITKRPELTIGGLVAKKEG